MKIKFQMLAMMFIAAMAFSACDDDDKNDNITFEVVQCRGLCNENTEYHERIIDLVNKNANLIRERLKAA